MDCKCILYFKTEADDVRSFIINGVENNLTPLLINSSMDDILANNIFDDKERGKLTEKQKAIYTKTSVWNVRL